MKTVAITTPYITLGQLLKFSNLAQSGGAIKMMLEAEECFVDGVLETRRGRKLYPGMTLRLIDGTEIQVTHAADQSDA